MLKIVNHPFRHALSAIILLGAAIFSSAPAFASTVTSGGAISQGYQTGTGTITNGMLLTFQSQQSKLVTPASSGAGLVTIVGVAADNPLLEQSSTDKSMVQVALSGALPTLVSDINGSVNVGDKIAASPIPGVGMKAVEASNIVGTAQGSLGAVSTVSRTVTDRSGARVTVKVGLVPVAVAVGYYSGAPTSGLSSVVPSVLQNLANAISGKTVSPLRVVICAVIMVLGTAIIIAMLSTAIKSGIISIGRNPLAEKALRKGLMDVVLAAVGILLICGVTVYAVLTR